MRFKKSTKTKCFKVVAGTLGSVVAHILDTVAEADRVDDIVHTS